MRVKKRLRQKKNDEDCCFCRPRTRPPHRRRQSRPVAIHSRHPRRRPLCCRFVTGRFVVVVVVVVVAVVVTPSLHSRRRILRAADSRRYCAVVVSWSRHRRAIVAPLSHHLPAIGGRRASRRRVGLASEWWWWLAVGVYVWEWRRWWASVRPVAVTVVVADAHST
ncbi:hypothetical protein EDB85DRAFT_1894062 [Lactarius pseudohatsudake]|nr:hypothetical protein EDB85DRAFT_1894062 [Lactarius pseudohatsudake]